MSQLGFSLENQHYLDLPDGELSAYQDEITEQIIATIALRGISQIVTLGRQGYDEHPDHITTHLAAEAAAKELRATCERRLGLLALNAVHNGEHRRLANLALLRRKLGAMACHRSQFPIEVDHEGATIDTEFWQSFSHYHPLIFYGETYNIE